MPKNGSHAHKNRVKAHATRSGKTYRQAAHELVRQLTDKERLQHRIDRYDSQDLAEYREMYQRDVAEAGLPESVKVCLYVLSERFGTGRLINPMGVRCTMTDLGGMAGLNPDAASLSMAVAEAHGWTTKFHDHEARLKVPKDEIELFEHFLKKETKAVAESDVCNRVRKNAQRNEIEQASWREIRKSWHQAHGHEGWGGEHCSTRPRWRRVRARRDQGEYTNG